MFVPLVSTTANINSNNTYYVTVKHKQPKRNIIITHHMLAETQKNSAKKKTKKFCYTFYKIYQKVLRKMDNITQQNSNQKKCRKQKQRSKAIKERQKTDIKIKLHTH